ncbi:hypothetical protein BHC46_02645 [Snodgrassella alvi]|uniref:Type VI secretion system spike protein VgrG3-like C-terminal domain-containing protein n=1 Tax=Snodgrassella alvi TaxID=1196083 RepID=A0A2N9XLF0_9NEIS|nr:hypothetical protein [Snodgrassella alvi]PIT49155.1 hypothetical protein BHC46_02645 [Snodgrassella alvi]
MATNVVEQMLIELGFADSKFASEAEKAIKKNKELEKSLTDTEKASKKSEKANDELAKKQHNAIEQTAKFGEAIAKVTKELTGFFAIIIGSTGLFKLANDAARANMEVSKLSGQLGMNTRSITDWRSAAGAFGGSAEGMTASLTGIKQAMNGLVMFGDASMLPYFNALGVNVVDNAGKVRQLDDVMLDLADAFQKMPRDQAYTIGKKMGFDDGTINALVSGRKELQEILAIQKQMYHSDEKAIARSKELTKQQAILNAHWQSMKQMIGDALTPILISLIKVVNGFFEFLQKHEKVITTVFKVAAVVIGMLLIPTLLSAGRALLGFIAPFTPLIRIFGLLGAAISPVTLAITALGAAFVLLYDDYKTWVDGGKSLFNWSSFVDGIKDSKLLVESLRESFIKLGVAVRDSISDSAIELIAKATGEDKEDIAGFIGESAYKLTHGGKDYYEQNGIEKPVDANLPVKTRGTNKAQAAPQTAAQKAPQATPQAAENATAAKREANVANKSQSAAKPVAKSTNTSTAIQLGALSAKYEGKVGSANRDNKGWAYGKYQFNDVTGGLALFFKANPEYAKKFSGLKPGTNAFNQKWRELAKNERDSFEKAQDKAAELKFYKPNQMFAKNLGYKLDDNGVREAIFSAAINHGGVKKILSSAAKNEKFAQMSAQEQINALYNARADYVKHTKIAGGDKVKNALYKRYAAERQTALTMSKQGMLSNGAQQALNMVSQSQKMQTSSGVITNNDNRKEVSVTIQKVEVKTASNTVSGNAVAAIKGVNNYLHNQLGVSMT